MPTIHRGFFFIAAAAALALFGCSLQVATPIPTVGPALYVATVGALQTRAVETAGAQGFGVTDTPAPTNTLLPLPSGAPESPLVTSDTLCWRGPGPQYEVISSVKQGTAVSLLGRGVIAGWFVIRNPIYGDPCWIQANVLQIPSSVDVSALPVYNPPWTPTVTPPPTSAVTGTPPSPTSTP
jgi:hypothetical protein